MSHLKRQKVPKKWPIPRKGTKYIIRPSSNIQQGIPILIILRDVLKLAQNRKEVKKALYLKKILFNGKLIKNDKESVLLFDVVTIVPSKQNFRLELSANGKFHLQEIKEIESTKKIAKIVDKKTLKGKKTQLNLSDGRNLLSNIECKVNDSVLINLKEKKIEKSLPFKENAEVIIFAGKHTGEKGTVTKIMPEIKMAELNIAKKIVPVLIKQFMVVK